MKYWILIIIYSLLFSLNAQKADSSANEKLENELKKLSDQVTEVRRDQLNYQIEKDLLKETYSSNMDTINIVIAIILAIFGIIGFLV